ncbi:site-specific integrase [Ktedonospora formicarum]|nr:site-specific integrase [Ktedonospora formicarum]
MDNAILWGLVSQNVTTLASLPRVSQVEQRALTREEANKLVEAARGTRLETLLILALTTAMRRGELLGLRWDDIDFKHKTLQVRRSLGYIRKHGFVISEPKTKTSRRKIMLTDFAIEALKKHRSLQDERRGKSPSWTDMNLVFCNIHGGYWMPEHMVTMFHKLLEKAQLPRIRFHDLRHSAATLLLAMGVHPKIVQNLLGHSKISTTMDTYSHVLPSMQKEIVDKMGLVFKQEDEMEGLGTEEDAP